MGEMVFEDIDLVAMCHVDEHTIYFIDKEHCRKIRHGMAELN